MCKCKSYFADCICENQQAKPEQQRVPHKHAALIKAWADGAKIQCADAIGGWYDTLNPTWDVHHHYRIKPEPKPDVVKKKHIKLFSNDYEEYLDFYMGTPNVQFMFDGETGKLKSVKLLS